MPTFNFKRRLADAVKSRLPERVDVGLFLGLAQVTAAAYFVSTALGLLIGGTLTVAVSVYTAKSG